MYRFFLFISFCFLLHLNVNSQTDSSRWTIVVSPAIVHPFELALQPGVQYQVSEKWTVLAEAAFPLGGAKKYEEITYWRTSLEVRYSRHPSLSFQKYIGYQVSYFSRHMTHTALGNYYEKSGRFEYDAATISSPVWANALKLGFTSTGTHLFADIFCGVGVRFVFTRIDPINPRPISNYRAADYLGWIFGPSPLKKDFTSVTPHLTMGFRVGWKL